MRNVHLTFWAIISIGMLVFTTTKAQDRLPEYLQAEKFTQEKLGTMLFSTTVDPHWFQQGNNIKPVKERSGMLSTPLPVQKISYSTVRNWQLN